MAKKAFRSMTIGIVVFAVAILAGYLAYTVTYRHQTEKIREELMAENVVSASTVYDGTDRNADTGPWQEHYLARLEGNDIAVYMVMGNEATFLYRLNVYTGNFPANELLRLREGVVLKNRQELVAFEEDYTS